MADHNVTNTKKVKVILDYLCTIQTRCTYAAIAEVLGIEPQSVGRYLGQMRPEASWVVNGKTGEPTGYTRTSQKHPCLYKNQLIIRSGNELQKGMDAHRDDFEVL